MPNLSISSDYPLVSPLRRMKRTERMKLALDFMQSSIGQKVKAALVNHKLARQRVSVEDLINGRALPNLLEADFTSVELDPRLASFGTGAAHVGMVRGPNLDELYDSAILRINAADALDYFIASDLEVEMGAFLLFFSPQMPPPTATVVLGLLREILPGTQLVQAPYKDQSLGADADMGGEFDDVDDPFSDEESEDADEVAATGDDSEENEDGGSSGESPFGDDENSDDVTGSQDSEEPNDDEEEADDEDDGKPSFLKKKKPKQEAFGDDDDFPPKKKNSDDDSEDDTNDDDEEDGDKNPFASNDDDPDAEQDDINDPDQDGDDDTEAGFDDDEPEDEQPVGRAGSPEGDASLYSGFSADGRPQDFAAANSTGGFEDESEFDTENPHAKPWVFLCTLAHVDVSADGAKPPPNSEQPKGITGFGNLPPSAVASAASQGKPPTDPNEKPGKPGDGTPPPDSAPDNQAAGKNNPGGIPPGDEDEPPAAPGIGKPPGMGRMPGPTPDEDPEDKAAPGSAQPEKPGAASWTSSPSGDDDNPDNENPFTKDDDDDEKKDDEEESDPVPPKKSVLFDRRIAQSVNLLIGEPPCL